MEQMLFQQGPPLPFSAFALCYIPLAVVVIGLIVFFVMTDRHASRPYLRYNPFLVATATPEELERRPPTVGETPAGSLQAPGSAETMVYQGGRTGDVAPARKEDVPPPAAPDIQPPLEGVDEGVGHSPADDEPPRKGIDDSPV